MILILGCVEDPLTAEVHQRMTVAGSSVLQLSEGDLFAATPFSLEIDRTDRSGFLQCGVRTLTVNEITGVLFRLPRTWWPTAEFDLQDQLFVYHETASAWFALLSGLSCPQINRFELGWWVHDLSYPEQLRLAIVETLDMTSGEPAPTPQPPRRIFPTPVTESDDRRHVYLIGESIVPRSFRDRDIAGRLTEQKCALARWQQETGIMFCRLDFRQHGALDLLYVEPMPMMDGEPLDILDRVAARVTEALA